MFKYLLCVKNLSGQVDTVCSMKHCSTSVHAFVLGLYLEYRLVLLCSSRMFKVLVPKTFFVCVKSL